MHLTLQREARRCPGTKRRHPFLLPSTRSLSSLPPPLLATPGICVTTHRAMALALWSAATRRRLPLTFNRHDAQPSMNIPNAFHSSQSLNGSCSKARVGVHARVLPVYAGGQRLYQLRRAQQTCRDNEQQWMAVCACACRRANI